MSRAHDLIDICIDADNNGWVVIDEVHSQIDHIVENMSWEQNVALGYLDNPIEQSAVMVQRQVVEEVRDEYNTPSRRYI